jgi:NAD(P)-dependent dehydrogenase (short-subunit alcohol dehydrogenase family)
MAESTRFIDYGLSGKVALITGVSRRIGIGATVALELAKAGCNIRHSDKQRRLQP